MSARRLGLCLAALLASATLAAVSPLAARAQDDDEPEPAEMDAPTAASQQDDDDALVALGVLAFGAAALGMTLLYLNGWRRSSADLIRENLAVTGGLPEYELVAAAVPEPGARDVGTSPELSIRGPALLHVGRGARFAALLDGSAVHAEWAVEPAEAGRTQPAAGERTTVTPARLGRLTIRATAAGATAEAHAVAAAAPRHAGRVPLVGAGFGGITIAIIALTFAAAATAYGSLDGAALVALAGAIVGYFFVEARGQQAAPSDSTDSAAAPDLGGEG